MFRKRTYSNKKKYSVKNARGEPYKRYKSSVPKTVARYGDQVVHHFRRALPDISLFAAGGGAFTYANNDGFGVGFLTLGTTTADQPSAPSLYSFGGVFQLSLNNLINAVEFQNLFHQYRIRRCVTRISMDNADTWPQQNGPIPSTLPSVYIATDPNDATVPGTSAVLQQYGDMQVHEFRHDKPIFITWYPKPAVGMFVGVINTGYAAPDTNKQLWLDTTTPSDTIAHYALKMFFRNVNNDAGAGLCLRFNNWLEFDCRALR